MGSFANSVFTLLLGWVSGMARFLWDLVSGGSGGALWKWITDHWILLAGILCLAGIVIDLMVYIFRWEPFRMWRNPWSRRAQERRMNRDAEENDGGRMRGMAPVTKRRRRLNVATLFSEAEEDLMTYQKPETIIDRHQAYHEPVYPRRWKESGDENDE